MQNLLLRLCRAVPFVPMTFLLFAAAANAGQGDLSIRIDDELSHTTPGLLIIYAVTTHNAGPDAVEGLVIAATVPAASCTWTCSSTAGQCQTTPALGASLPAGAQSRHVATCGVPISATGSLTAHAVLQPPGDFTDLDSSNDQSTDTTQVLRRAILRITLADAPSHVAPGDPIAYTLKVSNVGPDAITGAHVAAIAPPQYTNCAWTCSSGGSGAACTNSGTGDVNDAVTLLPPNGGVNYAINCTVSPAATGIATTSATVRAPPGSINIDPLPGASTGDDASASDSNVILPGPMRDTAMLVNGLTSHLILEPTDSYSMSYGYSLINRGAIAADVQFQAVVSAHASWQCVTPGCTIASGTGNQIQRFVTLPPRTRWNVLSSFTGQGANTYHTSASLTVPPDDPFPGDNATSLSTVVSLFPRPLPSSDVSIALVSAPPPRVALGDLVEYRFRASAPAEAYVSGQVQLPAYVYDVVPACAATSGLATCAVGSLTPSVSPYSLDFIYHFSIKLYPGSTADFALRGRVSRRPFPDYWNESLRVRGRASGIADPNPLNDFVTVDTALSLFRGSFEAP